MPKSTDPIAYRYSVEGATVTIERVHIGTAYARNGNVGNPTEYFRWNWNVETGKKGNGSSRSDAYERARASVLGIRYVYNDHKKLWVNVRPWTLVRDEMRANYRGRVKSAEEVDVGELQDHLAAAVDVIAAHEDRRMGVK